MRGATAPQGATTYAGMAGLFAVSLCVFSLCVFTLCTVQVASAQVRSDSTVTGTRTPAEYTRPAIADRLGQRPGAFLYDFGTAGWPDGVSIFGADPSDQRLTFDSIPLHDPFSGRALLEVAPSLLASGNTSAIASRPLNEPRPLTLIRYMSTGDGLQSADVLHVQNRQPGFARGGHVQALFGYAGAAGSGEYDGSALRRARQIMFRLIWSGSRGWLRLSDLNTRHRIGAHAGVEPFNASYASIYQRLGASVTNEDDERQLLRNDLSLAAGTQVGVRALEATVYRTWQTNTFLSTGDDVRQRAQRTGMSGRADLAPIGRALVTAEADIRKTEDLWFTDIRASIATHADSAATSAQPAWSVRPGFVRSGSAWTPAVDADLSLGGQRLTVSYAPLEESLDNRDFFAGAPPVVLAARLELEWHRGPWRAATTPYVRRYDQLRVFTGDDRDRTSVLLDAPAIRYGLSTVLGWDSGTLYATVNPVISTAHSDSDAAEGRAWEQALPDWWISGRVGTRMLLFTDDLDLDASVRIRAWPTFAGRTLHTPTGLLILRDAGERAVPAASAIDLVFEGGIRGATLFFAWENILSGTNAMPGNQLVPDYPLPEQRIRFGVYWPISN